MCGLGIKCRVVDCGAAVVAEDSGGVDGIAAGSAAGNDGRRLRGSEDLASDVGGLHGVVATDARGHDEGLEDADDGGDAGPKEDEIEDAEAVASQIEVMDAETAEKDGEEDADHLVFAGTFVFGVEPGPLMVVHVDGVDGIDSVHRRSS